MTRPVLYNRAVQLTASYCFTLPADTYHLLLSLCNSPFFPCRDYILGFGFLFCF